MTEFILYTVLGVIVWQAIGAFVLVMVATRREARDGIDAIVYVWLWPIVLLMQLLINPIIRRRVIREHNAKWGEHNA